MTDPNTITDDYLAAVAINRQKSRETFGDDYDSGKSAAFLIAVLIAAIGEVADEVIGNTSQSMTERVLTAQELVVAVGGICASLHEWLEREAEAIANESDEPV